MLINNQNPAAINYSKIDYTADELNKFHTRQLLNYMNALRKHDYDYATHEDNIMIQRAIVNVRTVLANRPHIPSKQESKLARIQRKKSGSSR
jgi:hypothetical protein